MSLFDRLIDRLRRRLFPGLFSAEEAIATEEPDKWRLDAASLAAIRGNPDTPPHVLEALARVEALDLPLDLPRAEIERRIKEAVCAGDPANPVLTVIVPAPDAGEARLPDGGGINGPWSRWAAWTEQFATPPGWAACQFAVRLGDQAHAVYGMVKAEFGVFSAMFSLCGDGVAADRQHPLAVLVHLPSGYNLGLFCNRRVAMEAASLATALAWDNPDCWRTAGLADAAGLTQLLDRLKRLWASAGLVAAPYHAHTVPYPGAEGAGPALPVWMLTDDTITLNKPPKERLS